MEVKKCGIWHYCSIVLWKQNADAWLKNNPTHVCCPQVFTHGHIIIRIEPLYPQLASQPYCSAVLYLPACPAMMHYYTKMQLGTQWHNHGSFTIVSQHLNNVTVIVHLVKNVCLSFILYNHAIQSAHLHKTVCRPQSIFTILFSNW